MVFNHFCLNHCSIDPSLFLPPNDYELINNFHVKIKWRYSVCCAPGVVPHLQHKVAALKGFFDGAPSNTDAQT